MRKGQFVGGDEEVFIDLAKGIFHESVFLVGAQQKSNLPVTPGGCAYGLEDSAASRDVSPQELQDHEDGVMPLPVARLSHAGRLFGVTVSAFFQPYYHPVFEFIPVESLIIDHQADYYAALEASDWSGDSTAFAEFSLATIHEALSNFLHELKIVAVTGEERVELARRNFAAESFSRKQDLAHFKTISTATASRDLKLGVERGFLTKQGEKAQTGYRYSQ